MMDDLHVWRPVHDVRGFIHPEIVKVMVDEAVVNRCRPVEFWPQGTPIIYFMAKYEYDEEGNRSWLEDGYAMKIKPVDDGARGEARR